MLYSQLIKMLRQCPESHEIIFLPNIQKYTDLIVFTEK